MPRDHVGKAAATLKQCQSAEQTSLTQTSNLIWKISTDHVKLGLKS